MEQRKRTVCPCCSLGCGMYIVRKEHKGYAVDYFTGHPVNRGGLCPAGNRLPEVPMRRGRLLYPMVRKNGALTKVSWDGAIKKAAESLKKIIVKEGPGAVGFLCSSFSTNEEAYLLQKLARLLGTHNVDSGALPFQTACNFVLQDSLGFSSMTNPVTAISLARCIIIIGCNFSEEQSVLSRWILDARAAGAKVIVIDYRLNVSSWQADTVIQLKTGSDLALVNGIIASVLKQGLYDSRFILRRTRGFREYSEWMNGFEMADAERATGVSSRLMEEVARTYARAESAAIIWGKGITCQPQGSDTVSALINLALICGQIGKKESGLYPLGGIGNIQGVCDMGMLPEYLPGYRKVENSLKRGEELHALGVCTLQNHRGMTALEMLQAARAGKIKALYIVGQDPAAGFPHRALDKTVLNKLELLVVQDYYAGETMQAAHVVLAGRCWPEKDGTITSDGRRVQWISRAMEPPAETLSDSEIIIQLANELGLGSDFNFSSPEEIFEEIRSIIPFYAGMTAVALKESPGGLCWPYLEVGQPEETSLYLDVFQTFNGLARLQPLPYLPAEPVTPSGEFPYLLLVGKRLRETEDDRVTRTIVEINKGDAVRQGIENNDNVILFTSGGKTTVRAVITSRVPQGVVFIPFYNESLGSSTTGETALCAPVPEFRTVACRVEKAGGH